MDAINLQEQFNKYKAALAKELQENKSDETLKKISAGIHELQSIGIDVSLDLHYSVPGTADDEYNQNIRKAVYNGCSSTSVVGEMSIGAQKYPVALCVRDSRLRSVLVFYVFDPGRKDHSGNPTFDSFDFIKDDGLPINRLQRYIMEKAAQETIVSDYDVANSFGPREPAANAPKTPLNKRKL